MKRFAIFAGLLCATAGMAPMAHARDGTEASREVEVVPYEVVDLTSDAGVRGLQQRIRRAAVRVCARPPVVIGTHNGTACVTPAANEAFTQVDRLVARVRSGALASAGTLTVRAR